MRRADEDVLRLEPAAFLNLRARLLHDRTRDEKQVNADERDALFAVVEHGRAHFARIVDARGIGFAVIPRHLHADLRRDVAFGESDFERRLRDRGDEGENEGKDEAVHDSCAIISADVPAAIPISPMSRQRGVQGSGVQS